MKAELEKLQKQKDTDVTKIESNYGSLEELKRAKSIITKVTVNIKLAEQEKSRQTTQKLKQEFIE